MALEISNSFWAQCSVDAGNPPAYVYSRGFAAAITVGRPKREFCMASRFTTPTNCAWARMS